MIDEKMGKVAKGERKRKRKRKKKKKRIEKKSVPLCSQDFMLMELEIKRS
jgi:hypothetical protein